LRPETVKELDVRMAALNRRDVRLAVHVQTTIPLLNFFVQSERQAHEVARAAAMELEANNLRAMDAIRV
jgi:hypothetical protein